jgi:hypothetical protein
MRLLDRLKTEFDQQKKHSKIEKLKTLTKLKTPTFSWKDM